MLRLLSFVVKRVAPPIAIGVTAVFGLEFLRKQLGLNNMIDDFSKKKPTSTK